MTEPVRPFGRLRRWTLILSAFFSANTLIQLTGLASGLLFIRYLSVDEFALYTLAMSVVTLFSFATDLGSTSSLMYFFREVAGHDEEFAGFAQAVRSLRGTAFFAGSVLVAAIFPALALGRGFPLAGVLLCLVGVIATVGFQIRAALGLLALRLRNRYAQAYRAEITGSCLRLALAAGIVLAAWTQAPVALASGVIATWATARLSGRISRVAVPGPDQAEKRRRVLRYLRPTLPTALYFAAQGPLLVWLSATFGDRKNIAEVGALSRLGLVMGLLSALAGVVFLPHLARIADDRLYRVRFLQFGAAIAAWPVALLAAAALAPRVFLLVLGPHYQGLETELLWLIGAAGFALLDSYFVSVNLARSWTRFQAPMLIVQVAAQAWMIVQLPLSSTSHVMMFNLFSAALACVLQVATLTVGFTRPAWVHWR